MLAWLGWWHGPHTKKEHGIYDTEYHKLKERARCYDIAQAAITNYQATITELTTDARVLREERTEVARELAELHTVNTILTNQATRHKASEKKIQGLELELEDRDKNENQLREQLGSMKKKLLSKTTAGPFGDDHKTCKKAMLGQVTRIKSLEEALAAKPIASKESLTEVSKESLDTIKRLNATIEGLNLTLKSKGTLVKHLKRKDAKSESDHLDYIDQAKKQEKRIQALQDELAAEKKPLKLDSIHEEKDPALAAREELGETITRLEDEKQRALETSTELQGKLDKKDEALRTKEQALVENQRLLKEKEAGLASIATNANEQTCDHSPFKRQVQEKEAELVLCRQSHQKSHEELQIAQGKASEAIDELRRLQDVLQQREDHIAQMIQYSSSVNDLHNEIKEWIGVPGECDVPQLHFLLRQWMMKAKEVESQVKAKSEVEQIKCRQKVEKAETAARSHLRKLKEQEKLNEQANKKHEELRNEQAAAIERTRREALLYYETSDPANRPLKQTLWNTQQSLKRTTEDLASMTRERDKEEKEKIKWLENQKEWVHAFGLCKGDLKKFKKAFEESKQACEESKQDCEQERGKVARLENEGGLLKEELRRVKMKLSQECDKHGEIPTASGQKRGPDENGGAVKEGGAPHKRVRDD